MKRALLALLVVAGALPAFAGDAAQPPRDMVVLTVSGLIGKTNRGPLDQKRDSLLARQKIDFAKAFAFDRAMLLALEQGTVRIQPPGRALAITDRSGGSAPLLATRAN